VMVVLGGESRRGQGEKRREDAGGPTNRAHRGSEQRRTGRMRDAGDDRPLPTPEQGPGRKDVVATGRRARPAARTAWRTRRTPRPPGGRRG
jgi:hypothetical protein